ncbi:uncharacterized protein PSANT_02088 [Moesziomyces antarcticus]|uniref:Uncharacterized protein n=1 Tax=Pseudozyma antarctica TaxID=84753 RepID=A0A5C3FJ47_PSEA2|nr:uncharacterized protein PSANT_02088 [Moesziomyces antarcticus]
MRLERPTHARARTYLASARWPLPNSLRTFHALRDQHSISSSDCPFASSLWLSRNEDAFGMHRRLLAECSPPWPERCRLQVEAGSSRAGKSKACELHSRIRASDGPCRENGRKRPAAERGAAPVSTLGHHHKPHKKCESAHPRPTHRQTAFPAALARNVKQVRGQAPAPTLIVSHTPVRSRRMQFQLFVPFPLLQCSPARPA